MGVGWLGDGSTADRTRDFVGASTAFQRSGSRDAPSTRPWAAEAPHRAINAANSPSAHLCYNSWMEEPRSDPVLARLRTAVTETYGVRLERVVLFGSRARGDAKPDSDYDVAVFIKNAGSFADESARLAALTTDILLDTGAVISATPFPSGTYRERTGFMHELRKDGLVL